jgi:hypothetical protein
LNAWGPDDWNALAQMLLAFAFLSGGLWGLYTYQQAQRTLRGQWLGNIFADFYCKYSFENVRSKFEHNYDLDLRPLVQQRVTDRDIAIGEHEIGLLLELDNLLNYFENILYLEENGLLRKRERLALFQYWFEMLCEDEQGEIRAYINQTKWTRLADLVGRTRSHHLFLYDGGSEAANILHLMPDLQLRYIQPDRMAGRLYELDGRPCARLGGADSIKGCLYEILDLAVLKRFDKMVGFDPAWASDSPRTRKCRRTRDRRVDAWCYEHVGLVADRQPIPAGDWPAWLAERDAA